LPTYVANGDNRRAAAIVTQGEQGWE